MLTISLPSPLKSFFFLTFSPSLAPLLSHPLAHSSLPLFILFLVSPSFSLFYPSLHFLLLLLYLFPSLSSFISPSLSLSLSPPPSSLSPSLYLPSMSHILTCAHVHTDSRTSHSHIILSLTCFKTEGSRSFSWY